MGFDQNAQSNAGLGRVNEVLNSYWAHMAPHYYVPDIFGRRMLASYLVPLCPQSLIEVGCGSGELFSIFRDIPLVVGVDWQEGMLKRSAERIARHEYKNIELQKLDITQPLILEMIHNGIAHTIHKKFDIALTRTVLMHIDPKDIDVAVRNMTLLSDRVLAFEFYNPQCEEKLEFHNWHHEYPALFAKQGYKVVDAYQRPDGVPQVLFNFVRQPNATKKDRSAVGLSNSAGKTGVSQTRS